MTREEILNRYPRASESFIRANLSDGDSGAHNQSSERPKELATSSERQARDAECLHCCFTLKRKSLLDVDAKYASTKDLLDCLTIAGVIRGDKEGQITLEVNQLKCKKGEPEEITIEVFRITTCEAQTNTGE